MREYYFCTTAVCTVLKVWVSVAFNVCTTLVIAENTMERNIGNNHIYRSCTVDVNKGGSWRQWKSKQVIPSLFLCIGAFACVSLFEIALSMNVHTKI